MVSWEHFRAVARSSLWHVVVALAYFASLALFRQIIIPQYVLLSGMRVAVLILLPYRYWPALVVGEELLLIPMSVICWSQLGSVWGLLNLVPATLYGAPIIYLARRYGSILKKGYVSIGVLLASLLSVSFICTAYNLLMLSVARLPTNYPVINYKQMAVEWWLGNFLGMLAIVPAALVFYQAVLDKGWRRPLQGDLFVSVFFVMPILLFLTWLGTRGIYVRMISQVTMFIPVVWLALRHGWKGAALSGTLASIGNIAILLSVKRESSYSTLEVETLIAVAISTMLIVGARIALLDRRVSDESAHARMAMALARRNAQFGEVRLRTAALAMEQVRETAHDVFRMMLLRLRHLQPAVDDAGYRRHVSGAQDRMVRLADSLYPAQLHGRSLPMGLREGAIVRVLQEAGVAYTHDVRGPISLFSQALHVTLYRLVCEAVAQVCVNRDATDVRVRIRCGCHARLWVVLQVDAGSHPVGQHFVRWDELLPQLHQMTAGLDRKAMEDRAATFEGRFRERNWRGRQRISMLLLDPGDGA